mmetsp:Transcript_8303/g.21787  ORF Transcript_8303/g.21787 Transcript_8303/m.21787 type:complete len:150 (+) Transcript_8303:179-628(+)
MESLTGPAMASRAEQLLQRQSTFYLDWTAQGDARELSFLVYVQLVFLELNLGDIIKCSNGSRSAVCPRTLRHGELVSFVDMAVISIASLGVIVLFVVFVLPSAVIVALVLNARNLDVDVILIRHVAWQLLCRALAFVFSLVACSTSPAV